MKDTRIIRVAGKGTVSLPPDTTRLNINVTGTYKAYADTLKHSAEDTEQLREALTGLGFAPTDLKTLSFGVDTRYEHYQDKNGNYRQRFAGYIYNHSMKLEFPCDNELLGKLLYALGQLPCSPEFSIAYTVKDKEKAKNLLIANAVADSKAKAAVLAEASGVSLGEIQSIDYSLNEPCFEVMPMNGRFKAMKAEACCEDAAYGVNIQAEDIVCEDTVTIVWAIV